MRLFAPVVRPAQVEDIVPIKRIINAPANRMAFGFVSRAVHEAAIASQQLPASKDLMLVADNGGAVAGFLRAYHRNDGFTTLHEIAVHPLYHRQGVGCQLLEELEQHVRAHGQQGIQLRTPAEIAANQWYVARGFNLIAQEPGRKRPLNLYRMQLG